MRRLVGGGATAGAALLLLTACLPPVPERPPVEPGNAVAWGDGADGSLWTGAAPAALPLGATVVDVAVGERAAVAVLADGTLWSWGENGSGQLGDGTGTQHLVPVQVGNMK